MFADSQNFKKSKEFQDRLLLFEETVGNIMVAENKPGKNQTTWYPFSI